jgi:hypothetical protein
MSPERQGITIPRFLLPIELWKYIFRFATAEPPNVFETPPLPPFFLSTKLVDNEVSNSIVFTRKAIVLVCRQWRALGTDLLYENVTVRGQRGLVSFSEALENNWKEFQTSNDAHRCLTHHFGWYIKRLRLISTFFQFTPKGDETQVSYVNRLVSCLRLCGNLDEVIFESSPLLNGAITSKLACPFLATNPLRLRRFEWDNVDARNLFSGLTDPSALEVLSLTTPGSFGFRFDDVGTVSFPRLHTLKFIGFEPYDDLIRIEKWDMPLLQNLCIGPFEDVPDPECYHLFERCGAQLKYLDFCGSCDFRLSLALNHCTSLEELSIYCYAADDLVGSLPLTLKRLGIRLKFDDFMDNNSRLAIPPEELIVPLERALPMIYERRTPSLTSVRLIDFDDSHFAMCSWETRDVKLWKSWIKLWADSGIRFEFSNGDLVEIPEVLEIYHPVALDHGDYIEILDSEDEDEV